VYKTLNTTVASIPPVWSSLNFFLNTILIPHGCSQILQLFYIFKGYISSQ
jgi:hypothetical protein